MYALSNGDFHHLTGQIASILGSAHCVDVGEWQSQKTNHDLQRFHEMHNVVLEVKIPDHIVPLQQSVLPNLPWAEDHFQERVGGKPLNPPPSSEWWPFAQNDHAEHTSQGKFSHTYPERYWPRHAGDMGNVHHTHRGIRYRYGDLADVVAMLSRSSKTRQAYLPVWFPEDTGATEGQRVPCTLGYHFQIRYGRVNCTYLMRSCDFIRHFADDVYMTGRLMQWVTETLNKFHAGSTDDPFLAQHGLYRPGILTMHIMNLHAFKGDQWKLHKMADDWRQRLNNTQDGHCED